MMYTANTTCGQRDRRSDLQRKLEKVEDWSRRPMTGRAQIAVPAIVGFLMTALFFTVYMVA